jgi:hypothetical protein
MMRLKRVNDGVPMLSAKIGDPLNAQRFTVNLSAEVAEQVRAIASLHRVSESSVVEVALRHLFRRVGSPALGAFLRDRGACLRRGS